jgi:ABC-2 type transport system permease protein
MNALWTYYRAQIKTSMAVQLQYRVAMAIWMIELVLQPVIYLVVWTTVARSSGGQVGGYTAPDFAAYYIVLMIVGHITLIWHMWEYEYLIRQGILSTRLLRPVHPIHEDASQNIAYKLLMLVVLVPSVLLCIVLFQPAFTAPASTLLIFIPAVLLAGILSFIVGWIVAMAAFWTTRIMAINQLYFVGMFFFSGQIAPLELLPSAVQTIAGLLPFRWMIGFPVGVLLGRVSDDAVANGLIAQLIWIGASVFVLRLIWRAGVRRFGAVGG